MWPEDELDFHVKTSEAPKKIYVSNYSSGLTYNWHNERLAVNDIEYVRKDAFVEEACSWLRNYVNPIAGTYLVEEDIEKFINYMKEE